MKLTYALYKEASPKENKEAPGDGLRSLRTSSVFRAVNFELYVKPNKYIMAFGLVSISLCIGYIAYMRSMYDALGYYPAIDEHGEEQYVRRKSKWDT